MIFNPFFFTYMNLLKEDRKYINDISNDYEKHENNGKFIVIQIHEFW